MVTTGKAVATRPTSLSATEQVKERLQRAITEMARPEQTAEEMALAILNATTLEGILGNTVLHMPDMEGISFLVVGANLNPSDYTEGLAAYAVLDTIQADGTRAVVISGAVNVVSQLIAMHAGNFFPAWVRFKKSDRPTEKGYFVWKLQKGEGDPPTQQQLAAWGEQF